MPGSSTLLSLLFADDTTLLNSDIDLNNLFEKTNIEFEKVNKYFNKNKLVLNTVKTRYVLFSTNRNIQTQADNFQLKLNNNVISRVKGDQSDLAIKFLGLYIDPQFSFKYHVQTISKKITSALFF